MEGIKRLKGWQMGVLVALFAVLLSTMFMPVVHYSGEVYREIVEEYRKEVKDGLHENTDKVTGAIFDDSWLGGLINGAADILVDKGVDELIEEITDEEVEDIDEDIEEKENDEGIKIRYISPARIMTHSLEKLLISKDAESDELEDMFGEDYKEYDKSYNILRVLFGIVYFVAAVAMILIIIGFVAGWPKRIPLIMNLIYSTLAAIFFSYLRYGLMNRLGKRFLELKFEDALNFLSTKPLNKLYSVALPIALIVIGLIIIVSIVSLVIGKEEEVLNYNRDYDYGGDFYDNNGKADPGIPDTQAFVKDLDVYNGGGLPEIGSLDEVSGYYDIEQFAPTDTGASGPIPIVSKMATSANGKVYCTKGVAVGQGFLLPQDRKVIVGKSPSKANLTINHPNVSNIHCSIRYNPAMNTYIVKDHSTNGTFVNGVRMPKDVALEYPAGTVLVLSDGTNEITLG